MASEDVTAELELDLDDQGTPAIIVSLRDLRGTGMWPRDYVALDLSMARELQYELNEAINELEKLTPQKVR